ncbi:MAG: hypothetical protein QOK16_4720 [Solirubrobacteraceae bacterium]|jgi:hypothetical protein|nr:hypothetical protein [Solirubrobacteraceae bacterium]
MLGTARRGKAGVATPIGEEQGSRRCETAVLLLARTSFCVSSKAEAPLPPQPNGLGGRSGDAQIVPLETVRGDSGHLLRGALMSTSGVS